MQENEAISEENAKAINEENRKAKAINEESGNEENILESASEESGSKEESSDEESIGTGEENSTEEETEDEEDPAENSIEDICDSIYAHLANTYSDVNFVHGDPWEENGRFIMEIIADDKIAFRQILSQKFTIKENQERAQGSYERNLRVYDKLSEEYMEKHGQVIMYMDQAEVTSIKTVKKIEKEEKS